MARGVKNKVVTKFKNTKKKPQEKIDRIVQKETTVQHKPVLPNLPLLSSKGGGKSKLSPRIHRLIAEQLQYFQLKRISKMRGVWLYVVLGTVCGIFLAGITFVTLDIRQNMAKKQQLQAQRVKLQSQILKWEKINTQYPGYRDGYLRVAVLAYQVGDIAKARTYVQKTLDVDPYFNEAQILNKLLDTQEMIKE